MKNYWLVSELFYPDEISTGFVMTKIAECLGKKQPINVICGPAGYEKGFKNSEDTLDASICIHRVNVPQLDKNKISSRIIRMLLLTLKMGWKIATKVKKGDELILVTNPASLLLMIRFIRMFKLVHYTIIVHDVFPENLVASGISASDSLLYKILLPLYNKAYNVADHLIAVGEDMKSLLIRKVSAGKKISVIPNWADVEEVFPIEDFDKSAYLGIQVKDKIVIGFAGNIGRVQGLEAFIDSFIKAANPEIVFTIIGEGALKEKLQQQVKDKGGSQIFFLGNKPRKEQVLFLNSCDIGLVSLCPGMYGLGVPSKTYNIMAAGKPVLFIGDKDAEVDLYIRKYDCGWAFNWQDENKVITFLKSITKNDWPAISSKGGNALHAAIADFSRDTILNRFQQTLTSE